MRSETESLKDKPTSTNRSRWLLVLIGVYLMGTFLWRALATAHEFPSPALRNMTIGLDLLCLVSLIGLWWNQTRPERPARVGWEMHLLALLGLLAGLGLFAIRLSGSTESWWTGHLNYELSPRREGEITQNKASSQIANTAANTGTEANTGEPAAPGSPSAAYKDYYAAYKNKDIAALKMLISKDTFSSIYATRDRKEADELIDKTLRQWIERPLGPSDAIRNEKITGKTATAETLTPKGNWEPREFVKEDGKWKLAN